MESSGSRCRENGEMLADALHCVSSYGGRHLLQFIEIHDPLADSKVIWNSRIKYYYKGGLRLEEDVQNGAPDSFDEISRACCTIMFYENSNRNKTYLFGQTSVYLGIYYLRRS